MTGVLCATPHLCISVLKNARRFIEVFQHRDTESTELHREDLIVQHLGLIKKQYANNTKYPKQDLRNKGRTGNAGQGFGSIV